MKRGMLGWIWYCSEGDAGKYTGIIKRHQYYQEWESFQSWECKWCYVNRKTVSHTKSGYAFGILKIRKNRYVGAIITEFFIITKDKTDFSTACLQSSPYAELNSALKSNFLFNRNFKPFSHILWAILVGCSTFHFNWVSQWKKINLKDSFDITYDHSLIFRQHLSFRKSRISSISALS